MKALESKTRKSLATRRKIVDAAMRLFLEQGFEKTTMREIAAATGLAPGAAYYYFESKEELIFDFYENSHAAHLPEAEKVLGDEKGFAKRLAGLIRAHLKVSEAYHEISKVLFKTAADPENPLSPFSTASKSLRDRDIALLGRSLEGLKLDKGLEQRLPELLWLFKMACILYWLHDRSAKRQKSYRLVDRGTEMLAILIGLSRLPILKDFSKKSLDLFDEFKFY